MTSSRQRAQCAAGKLARTLAMAVFLYLALGVSSWSELRFMARSGDVFAAVSQDTNPHPGTDYWRAIRHGETGTAVVADPAGGVLINASGIAWYRIRQERVAPLGMLLAGSVVAAIVLFFVVRGRVRITGGRAGRTVLRFSVYQRVVHWFIVSLFLLLALTGLILLYGRQFLSPLLGREVYSIAALAAKEAHNLFGPLFLMGLGMLFVTFVRDNFYARGDLAWLARGGGFLGVHASAGRFNPGEKIWFWLVAALGLTVAVSGLVLDFPNFGQGRQTLEVAHLVHAIVAIVFISIALGHIYLATLGTQGTLEGMTTGYVDTNWAKDHHDRWQPDSAQRTHTQGEMSTVKTAAPLGSSSADHA